MNQKTIALLTSTEGHHSISEAIRQVLEPYYQVKIYQQVVFLRSAYLLIYRFFPHVFKYPYQMSQGSHSTDFARQVFAWRFGRRLVRFLTATQPDFCITTYFMYLNVLEKYQAQTGVKFLNIIANPKTVHPIELSTYREQNAFFEEWGWFVRSEYEEPYDSLSVKKALGLPPKPLTILLAGGSEGNQKIISLLPSLLKHTQPLNLIIINGSNQLLKRTIDAVISRYATANKTVINLGFTQEMCRYLQAADLVVGKAGPNFLFEAVATQTPFLAISHISGQEDGNLEIIKEYNVGLVEEDTHKALVLLRSIIEQPTMLQSYSKGLNQLAAHNRQAKTKLLNYIAQQLS